MDFKRRDFIRLWMDTHGKVEQMRMQLGADGVLAALAHGHERRSGALHVGSAMKAITGRGISQ